MDWFRSFADRAFITVLTVVEAALFYSVENLDLLDENIWTFLQVYNNDETFTTPDQTGEDEIEERTAGYGLESVEESENKTEKIDDVENYEESLPKLQPVSHETTEPQQTSTHTAETNSDLLSEENITDVQAEKIKANVARACTIINKNTKFTYPLVAEPQDSFENEETNKNSPLKLNRKIMPITKKLDILPHLKLHRKMMMKMKRTNLKHKLMSKISDAKIAENKSDIFLETRNQDYELSRLTDTQTTVRNAGKQKEKIKPSNAKSLKKKIKQAKKLQKKDKERRVLNYLKNFFCCCCNCFKDQTKANEYATELENMDINSSRNLIKRSHSI